MEKRNVLLWALRDRSPVREEDFIAGLRNILRLLDSMLKEPNLYGRLLLARLAGRSDAEELRRFLRWAESEGFARRLPHVEDGAWTVTSEGEEFLTARRIR